MDPKRIAADDNSVGDRTLPDLTHKSPKIYGNNVCIYIYIYMIAYIYIYVDIYEVMQDVCHQQ